MSEGNVISFIPQPAEGPMPLGTVYIKLAEQMWPIPKLAVRQWRIVVPATFKLMNAFGPMFAQMRVEGEQGVASAVSTSHLNMSPEQMDGLVDIVQAALSRAHPRITKDHVLDMEAPVTELMAALPIIMKQAGLFVDAPASTRTSLTPGEATTESPTGTV